MLANHEPDHNLENLSDTEIYDAIRYLEPDPQSANEVDGDPDKDNGVVICVCLYAAILVCLVLVWFCWR